MEASQVEIPFSEDIQEAVEGLTHLGSLTTEVEFAGHTFGLRTLTAAEEIAAAVVIKPFKDTLKEPEAWAAAQVALALTHVDGDEDFCPQAGPDQTAYARARLNYITSNWYWITIDALFREYTTLLQRQVEAIRAVQNLSQRGLLTYSPLADALNVPGISPDEIDTPLPS